MQLHDKGGYERMTDYQRGFEDGILISKHVLQNVLSEKNNCQEVMETIKSVLNEIEYDLDEERLEKIKIRFCIID